MNIKKSKLDYELDLFQMIRIIWKEKIIITLIVVISFLIGYFLNKNETKLPSYEIKINIESGKQSDYIKFLSISSMLGEYSNFQKIPKTSNTSEKSLEGIIFPINAQGILVKFIQELLDYDEILNVLKNVDSIKKKNV